MSTGRGGSPTLSIVINNANNETFIGAAIASAMNQTVSALEVVVVDDGSTDSSREIIASYRDAATVIFQDNRGQTSAMNTGYEASSGDFVCFLDGDDLLFPTAVATGVDLLAGGAARACWPLRVVDREGRDLGRSLPDRLPATDPLAAVLEDPTAAAAPTSSNVWSRRFLDTVFPLPEIEAEVKSGSAMADGLLSMVSSLWGDIATTGIPQGAYRMHGANVTSRGLQERARRHVSIFERHCRVFASQAARRGIEIDADDLHQRSFWYKLDQSYREIAALAGGATVAVVDEGWGGHTGVRFEGVPFPEIDGSWAGAPPDDGAAIRALERARDTGVRFLAFFWPSFWWFDHFTGFTAELRSSAKLVASNERYIAFELG